MPKFNETLTAESYFEIDGKQHQKGAFDTDVLGDKLGVVSVSDRSDHLVTHTVFSDWTNNSDVAYASLSDLQDDFKTSFFF